MSKKNTQMLVAILVVVLLAAGGYYWMTTQGKKQTNQFVEKPAALPSGSSATDSSLQQDTASIDAQLKGLSSDQANVQSAVAESAQTQ